MKILFVKWKGLGNEDILEAFEKRGHDIEVFRFDQQGELHSDAAIENNMIMECRRINADVVFSFNYFPIIAKACYEEGVNYISWVYDSPYVLLYSSTVYYETNIIFTFDKYQYQELTLKGLKTIHYLPLAVNANRLNRLVNDEQKRKLFFDSSKCNKAPISFVGSMYTEKHNFFSRLSSISEKTRGYLDGVMEAQISIYGADIVEQLLTEDIVEELTKDLPLVPRENSFATREYLYAEYMINRQITARERKRYIEYLASIFGDLYTYGVDLYTPNKDLTFDGVLNHGIVDYYEEAPFVYNASKINLNITLRSIHSGIPLRCFEIIGAGGFLVSNYQGDFEDCFCEGEEYVAFDSKDDMADKVEYYLSHENERKEIARNGYNKALKEHSFEKRIDEMLSYIN